MPPVRAPESGCSTCPTSAATGTPKHVPAIAGRPTTISEITDRVLDDPADRQKRSLDRVYPVVFIDAVVVKIGDGQVANRPVYAAIAHDASDRSAT